MKFPEKIMVGTNGRDLVIGHDGRRMYPDDLMPHAEYVRATALAEAQTEIARLTESNEALTRQLMGQPMQASEPVVRYLFGKPLEEIARILQDAPPSACEFSEGVAP